MKKVDLVKFKLPDTPGIYMFLGSPEPSEGGYGKKRKILYIGKATSLKDRVVSYFARDILMTRSPLIAKMLDEAVKVEFVKTDSVLEALILEANEIKKHQPTFNTREKDDKSYNYVTITQEDFPRVLVTRGSGTYGRFPHGHELKEALKIIRKIFPFRDKCLPAEEGKIGHTRPCFNAQIGLCPGVCAGLISKKEYRKIIRHLILFFRGKKKVLVNTLKREMKQLAKAQRFEEADKVKRKIFALEHIQDIALIKKNITTNYQKLTTFRIEAYDVAHISGRNVVSVMTVVEDGEPVKAEYRKFKIKSDKNDDIANLKETLERRLAHREWKLPDIVVVDGGVGQMNAVKEMIKKVDLNIEVVAVVKDDRHKAREILGDKKYSREILLANFEAHRFAISYHRRLRGKDFKI